MILSDKRRIIMRINKKTAKNANENEPREMTTVSQNQNSMITEKENVYIDARSDNPTLKYHELVKLIQRKHDISALEISDMWKDKALDIVFGERLEDTVKSFAIHRKSRLLHLAERLEGHVMKKLDDYDAGIDDPKELMTGDEPFTAMQTNTILKGSFHNMTPKDVAAMAKDAFNSASEMDNKDPNDNKEFMQELSENYLYYTVNMNVDLSQFSTDGGFEGVSRRDVIIDVEKSPDEPPNELIDDEEE